MFIHFSAPGKIDCFKRQTNICVLCTAKSKSFDYIMKRYVVALKFMFSKKATKIDEIFTGYLTLCSKSQIDGEDFVNFCGLLTKHEL